VVESSQPAQVRALAKSCESQLSQIAALGQRHQIPSKVELDALAAIKPVSLVIPLIDGSKHAIDADSYTTVGEVETKLIAKLNLTFTEPFALYEVGSANVERLLDAKERILDIVASWENEPPDAEDNKAGTKGAPVYKSLYSSFLYKAKLVLKLSVPELAQDAEAIKLQFLQVRVPSSQRVNHANMYIYLRVGSSHMCISVQ